MVMSLIAVVITLAWFFVVANLIGALRLLFQRSVARRVLDAVSGSALLGLGARLALSGVR
jgi:threonine/homoserine/homoserine lactone efflux protein